MKTSELIQDRRSVRTFDGKAVEHDKLHSMLEYANRAENPFGMPIGWKLLSTGADGVSSPVIVGTDTFIAGKLKRQPHAEEAFGYSFEKMVLYAQSLGIGTTWIAGTMNRSVFEKAMELGADEFMPCVSPLGYPAKKMSVRETMMRAGVKADTRLDFSSLFFDGLFDKPMTPEKPGELLLPLELGQLSPSAVNKQPWRIVVSGNRVHLFEKKDRGYDNGTYDLQKVDVGIAMYNFEAALCSASVTATCEVTDPNLILPKDTEYIATYVLN